MNKPKMVLVRQKNLIQNLRLQLMKIKLLKMNKMSRKILSHRRKINLIEMMEMQKFRTLIGWKELLKLRRPYIAYKHLQKYCFAHISHIKQLRAGSKSLPLPISQADTSRYSTLSQLTSHSTSLKSPSIQWVLNSQTIIILGFFDF